MGCKATGGSVRDLLGMRNEFQKSILDGLAKSVKRRISVIPVKAGIQLFKYLKILWTPVSTGVTTFYEFIILEETAKCVRAAREPPLLDCCFCGNDEPERMAQPVGFLQRCPPKLPPEKPPCPVKPLPPWDPVEELPPTLRGVLKTPICCAVEGGLETCARGA